MAVLYGFLLRVGFPCALRSVEPVPTRERSNCYATGTRRPARPQRYHHGASHSLILRIDAGSASCKSMTSKLSSKRAYSELVIVGKDVLEEEACWSSTHSKGMYSTIAALASLVMCCVCCLSGVCQIVHSTRGARGAKVDLYLRRSEKNA